MRGHAAALGLALLLAAGAAGSQERFAQGLLWRITRQGVAPSHVFGTIHVSDARLAELPPPVRKAFDASGSLTLEFVADQYGRERFLEASMFLDRHTLEDKIGQEDFERAFEHLKPLGLSREFVNKLKPWGVLLNLRTPQPSQGVPLDAQLQRLARERRMALHQMELVEEQVFVFDDLPMDSQVALLKHSLAHASKLAKVSERALEAYLARDLAAIWRAQQEFVARHPEIALHNAALMKRILHDRNVVMAFRMQRQLRRGKAFVALGALHLYGAKGVLALLEEDGYRVRRVY